MIIIIIIIILVFLICLGLPFSFINVVANFQVKIKKAQGVNLANDSIFFLHTQQEQQLLATNAKPDVSELLLLFF